MKYTDYLMRDDKIIDFGFLHTKRHVIKVMNVPMVIFGSLTGILIIASFTPMTVTYDGYRSLKYQYLINNRKNRNHKIKNYDRHI